MNTFAEFEKKLVEKYSLTDKEKKLSKPISKNFYKG